jgi:hypothetical protein
MLLLVERVGIDPCGEASSDYVKYDNGVKSGKG